MKIKYIYLILIASIFAACDSKSHSAKEIQVVDTNKPVKVKLDTNYILTTTKDKKISFELSKELLVSEQLKNKIVLINFWAPWCKPCVKEMPTFVKLQKKYKNDLVIIGVLFDKKSSVETVKEFLKKHNVNFPITIGEENYRLAKNLDDVKMIPESFLYNREGLFIEKFVGEVNHATLENYLEN